MKKGLLVSLVSLIVATTLVSLSLQHRQEPKRTWQDAYIPIRSLTPIEVAAIFISNEKRKPSSYARIVINDITDKHIVVLTRNYVVPTNSQHQNIPESYAGVNIQGKSFRIVSNSWENYICQYIVDRIALENILGFPLRKTKEADIEKNGFYEDKISFSSKNIWIYAISEIVAISVLLIVIIHIFVKLHFLLWLPCLTALDISSVFFVKWYSPAFFDADSFYQRIIIEEIPLRFTFVGNLVFGSLYSLPVLSLILLIIYIIYKSLFLVRKK